MSTADMDVDMSDARPGGADRDEDASTVNDLLRFPAKSNNAASSNNSTRPFAGRHKSQHSGAPQNTRPQPSEHQRFCRACETLTEIWDHKLLRLLPKNRLPHRAHYSDGHRRLMNFKMWQRSVIFDLAELAKMEWDVELAAEYLIRTNAQRLREATRSQNKKLNSQDVKLAIRVLKGMADSAAEEESKKESAAPNVDAAVEQEGSRQEIPVPVTPKPIGEGRGGGQKLVLPIIGGRR